MSRIRFVTVVLDSCHSDSCHKSGAWLDGVGTSG